MWLNAVLLFNLFAMPKFVAARFCEGGHICSLPRECCTQGCCPPYQSGPRQLPPPSEHVLNLFFISHWFFWCVVVAIILAILCAYSLWKKRRTLCGWGFAEHNTQSEGDSAGSCYAPPQYSRCNSFHHPPPPYTEVTSKPDLYPLVFTCNSDNVKNGSSYLMVQYFRNYIVRPAGSLSAASTVDSLSSSFICNANEANTLVPPPYSRAASPEIGFSSPFQQHYMLPRSASQLVCANGTQQDYSIPGHLGYTTRNGHYTTVTITGVGGVGGLNGAAASTVNNAAHNLPYSNTLRAIAAPQPTANDVSPESTRSVGSGASEHQSAIQRRTGGEQQRFMQSQSDQHFRYMANSNSSISDIFVNNSAVNIANNPLPHAILGTVHVNATTTHLGTQASQSEDNSLSSSLAAGLPITTTTAATTHPQPGGTPVIFSNGCIKPNPLQRNNTNPTHFAEIPQRDRAVYNSCNSIGGISITVPVASGSVDGNTEAEYRDLHLLRRSLETCCQLLQQQQQKQQQNMPTANGSPLRLQEMAKKYSEEGGRSYMTSGTVSGVSSLTNIGTPSSPPQATSPTGEVRDILDQIRQLQASISQEELALSRAAITTTRPLLHHTMSSPTPTTPLHHGKRQSMDVSLALQRHATMPEQADTVLLTTAVNATAISPTTSIAASIQHAQTNNKMPANMPTKRPATLQKKYYTPKPNKAMYIPMLATTSAAPASVSRTILKSPVGSVVSGNFFCTRNRVRKGWISRSAPTTPGTALPPNRLGDDSPLLNEHDEDVEGEQNAEFD